MVKSLHCHRLFTAAVLKLHLTAGRGRVLCIDTHPYDDHGDSTDLLGETSLHAYGAPRADPKRSLVYILYAQNVLMAIIMCTHQGIWYIRAACAALVGQECRLSIRACVSPVASLCSFCLCACVVASRRSCTAIIFVRCENSLQSFNERYHTEPKTCDIPKLKALNSLPTVLL